MPKIDCSVAVGGSSTPAITRAEEIHAALAVLKAILEEGERRDFEIKLNTILHIRETVWERYHDCAEELSRLGLECCCDLGLEPRDVEIKPDQDDHGLDHFFDDLRAIRDWWESVLPFREAVREALDNWRRACRFADEHEREMWRAHAEGLSHVGWKLVLEAHERLTVLGTECMTEDQRRASPQQQPPDRQVEIYKPRAAGA